MSLVMSFECAGGGGGMMASVTIRSRRGTTQKKNCADKVQPVAHRLNLRAQMFHLERECISEKYLPFLNSQQRHGVINGGPADRILFGISSIPGAD